MLSSSSVFSFCEKIESGSICGGHYYMEENLEL